MKAARERDLASAATFRNLTMVIAVLSYPLLVIPSPPLPLFLPSFHSFLPHYYSLFLISPFCTLGHLVDSYLQFTFPFPFP